MNWLFPSFLAASALVGLPIVLHFLRSKPKTFIRFPSLRFLGESAIRDTRRHRLRRWLTLLLRCVIIAFLAAAFARPFWKNNVAAHRRAMVIAIDNSMSMQARGRWDEMRRFALRQLDELAPGDQAALLTIQPAPAWLAPMTDDLASIKNALQNAQPGFEKTRYDAALRVAGETLAANPSETKTLVWMADEQQLGWLGIDLSQTLPAGVKIRFGEAAPAPKHQAAIVALQWSPSASNDDEIIATVRLFAPDQDQRKITVRADSRVLAEQTISLHAGDNKIALRFPKQTNLDGVRVSLDADDLPADDTAWIALTKPLKAAVLLDSAPNTEDASSANFLAHALRATQKLGSDGIEPAALRANEKWPAESVVIARNASTFQQPRIDQFAAFVDAGGAAWIFVNGSVEQMAWLKKRGIQISERAATDDPWHLKNWDSEHPILSAFARQSLLPLLNVEFYRGFNLASDALTPLASWPDGKIALAEWSIARNGGNAGRVLLAGFSLDRAATNWPSQPSFVPFVHQTVRWLGSLTAAKNDWRIGDTIPLSGAGKWRALDAATPQKERDVNGSVRPDAPGLYEFSRGARNQITRKIFAVNFPPEESDLTPWPAPEQLANLEAKNSASGIETTAPTAPLSDVVAENRQRLWWWVLAICGAAILAELALSNRTAM